MNSSSVVFPAPLAATRPEPPASKTNDRLSKTRVPSSQENVRLEQTTDESDMRESSNWGRYMTTVRANAHAEMPLLPSMATFLSVPASDLQSIFATPGPSAAEPMRIATRKVLSNGMIRE